MSGEMRSTKRPARGCGSLRALSFGIVLVALLTADLASADRRPERRTLPQGVPPSAPARAARASDPALESAVWALRSAFGARANPARASSPRQDAVYLAFSRGSYVKALAAPPGHAYQVRQPGADQSPKELALAFMREHRLAFGISSRGASLHSHRVRTLRGRSYVRFQQRLGRIPVFGAGLVVQIEASGGVAFVLADLARDDSVAHSPSFPTEPVLGRLDAEREAMDAVLAESPVSDLGAAPGELMVYEPSVIGNVGPARLVWHVRVRGGQGAVDEVVLVDAVTGGVAFRYSQIMDARHRSVYDSANVPDSLGTLVRDEGDPAVGSPPDVDLAYDFLGDTYDFYFDSFGRDSLDDAGAVLTARVRYCEGSCPFANAYWNGSEMRFGDGFAAADDVVAHELTHAVTENESNLIYWSESGAINEALSDIFGELVDLGNGAGNDGPGVRWLIGEDLPPAIGAIRNMANPPAFSDPDRRYSPLWWPWSPDNRGVHTNSGVANKLAFLLTDGGTFNGQTVAGQGVTAVAALFYEAQVHLLVPGSDYFDLYAALRQGAINLGWSAASRSALESASRAVEIHTSAVEQTVFSDDFEGTFPGNWTVFDESECTAGEVPDCGTPRPPTGATWGRSTFRAASGGSSLYAGAGGPSPAPAGGPYKSDMDTWVVYGPFSLVDASDAWAEFDLYLDIEPLYDDDIFWGVSTNGVDFDGFAVQPESGCTGACAAPIWVREMFNFKDITFQPILGQPQVWLAFNFRSDEIIEFEGAYVDTVQIKTDFSCPAVVVDPWALPAAVSGLPYSQSVTQTGGSGAITWELSGSLPAGVSFNVSNATVSGTPTQTGDFDFAVTATDANGCSGIRDYTLTVGSAGPFEGVSLDVDAGGNRVLEAGELASLSPTWRLTSGPGQALTGTLTGFSGPGAPDPSYSVSDGTAGYGVVGTGASASCASASGNCYSLLISPPTSRPRTHWDTLARESLFNGQIKDWPIHVGESFDDVPLTSPFYPFIETLLHRSVTAGCSATGYCPTQATTREQMAVFVLRAKEGADYSPPACGGAPQFADVPVSSPFCPWIEELSSRGVVSGCGGGNYCPGSSVTREQMAVFVLKTLDAGLTPPACGTPVFGDVPASSAFCPWIEELERRGVVAGCGGGNYCPTSPVNREQMGVFLGKGFDLNLYGP